MGYEETKTDIRQSVPTPPRRRKNRRSVAAIMLAAAPVVSLFAPGAHGAAKTWVGNSDANWNTGANWSPSALNATADALTFNAAGTSGYTLVDDYANLSVGNVTFSASASSYSISGASGISLGLTATTISNASGVLQSFSVPINLNSTGLSFTGSGGMTFSGLLTAVGANRTLTNGFTSGTLTLGAINLSDSNTGHTLSVGGTGTSAITGIIADGGSGAGSLVYNGTGTNGLTLSGANTYSGGTTISSGGILIMSGSGTLGNTSGSLTVNNASVLDLNGTSQGVGNLSGTNSNSFILNNANGTTSTLTIGNGNNGGGTFAGTIKDNSNAGTGKVALVKTGSGTITLSAGNLYTGTTAINQGTLVLSGSVTNQIRGGLTIGDGTNTAALTYDSAAGDNRILDTAAVTISAHGSLNLSGRSDAINTINVNGGVVDVGAGGTLSQTSTSPVSTLSMTAGTIQNGTYVFTGSSGGTNLITINAAANKSLISSAMTLAGFSAPVSVADGAAGVDFEISGAIGSTSAIGIVKSGAGSMLLSSSTGNTYTGQTTINGGTLLAGNTSGSATGKGTGVLVNAGGTIGGTGIVGGQVATSNLAITGSSASNVANVAPGMLDSSGNSTIGSLTVGSSSFNNNATFGAFSQLSIQIDTAASDRLVVNGNLSLATTSDVLNLSQLDPSASGTFTIASYSGTLSGVFDTVISHGVSYSSSALPSYLTINYGTGSGSSITVSLVPEPSTLCVLLAGGGVFSLRRRRVVSSLGRKFN